VVDVNANDARQKDRRDEDPVGHGEYGPGALDEVTVPPNDPVREAKQRDIEDPADVTSSR
jgi:hypothetical protein